MNQRTYTVTLNSGERVKVYTATAGRVTRNYLASQLRVILDRPVKPSEIASFHQ